MAETEISTIIWDYSYVLPGVKKVLSVNYQSCVCVRAHLLHVLMTSAQSLFSVTYLLLHNLHNFDVVCGLEATMAQLHYEIDSD